MNNSLPFKYPDIFPVFINLAGFNYPRNKVNMFIARYQQGDEAFAKSALLIIGHYLPAFDQVWIGADQKSARCE